MKLIIQIPCINEAETLPLVFQNMPKKIDGIDVIEYQIMDDGSTDNTVEVANELGVHHIVYGSPKGKNRRWLGRNFKVGIDNALKQGADILVNTDGDNQYPSERIPDLVKPIVERKAEVVIGDRQTSKIEEFSLFKKFLQKFGSFVTQMMSGQKVPDAVSGFRAYSKTAMEKINIITDYTYTVDTLMQANKKGLDIEWIKIDVNERTRESRLIKNLWTKVKKSGATILRMYAIYEPFKTFLIFSSIFSFIGTVLLLRFLYFYIQGNGDGHIQSVIIGAISYVVSVQMFALGVIADLLAVNRRLIEDLIERTKAKN